MSSPVYRRSIREAVSHRETLLTPDISGARPKIPRAEYAARRDNLRADAAAAELDGVIAWSMGGSTLDRFANVFYLTNHYQPCCVLPDSPPLWTGFGHAGLVVPVEGPAALIVDQPDWRTDFVECDEVVVSRDVYRGVAGAVRASGLEGKRIGLTDEERMTVAAHRALVDQLPGTTFERADDLLMRRRMVKSDAEIEMMRFASLVGVEVMRAMMTSAAEGVTDGAVVAAGFQMACQLGAQPYDFAMASGPEDGHLWWARLPSWNWRRHYERGDIVHPDIYGAVDGYFYDFVRSLVVGGDPSAPQLELLEAGIGCIHAAASAALPGNEARDVYAAGRRYLSDVGLDHADDPRDGVVDLSTEVLESIGHGLGLGWEEPWLTPQSDVVLDSGMVLAIEQHVSRRGVGTIRYEEVVLVRDEGGPEILTSACPARWW